MPVAYGLPLGHAKHLAALPLGVKWMLDTKLRRSRSTSLLSANRLLLSVDEEAGHDADDLGA